MAYPFTHLVFSWTFAKVYEKVRHVHVIRTTWVLLFIGTLLPDLDFFIDWTFGTTHHRTITHSFLMVIIAFTIIFSFYRTILKDSARATSYGIAFAIGILSHIFIDLFTTQGVPLFWPSLITYSFLDGTHAWDPILFNPLIKSPEELLHVYKSVLLDTGVGLLWLSYLYARKKINSF